ncbi:MAG: phage holin family protein [Patescibacteria group bacterium]
MKRIVKHFVIDTVSLYVISQFVSGLVFAEGFKTIVITGAVLSITTLLIKPIINLLLLPLNLITFGLFKWVGYAVTLYIVTLLVAGFEIIGFSYQNLNFTGTLAIIAFSFVLSLLTSIITWIMK